MNAKITYILLVCLLLAPALACGGRGEAEQPVPTAEEVETPAEETTAEEPAAEEPVVDEPAAKEPVVEETAADEPTVTAGSEAGSGDDSFSAELAPVDYTPDGNPCRRQLYRGTALSGAGLEPINLDAGDAGETRGTVLAKLPHPDISFAAFVPPGGELMVTYADIFGGGEGDIQIWDWATGQEIRRLAHDDGYFSPAVSSEAPRLAAMAGDGDVWLWDLDDIRDGSGALVANAGQSGGLALSPDGRFIAVSSTETEEDTVFSGYWGAVRLFDTATGQEVQRFEGNFVEETVTSESGSFVTVEMENGHSAPIRWLGFSPNGQALLTLSWLDRTMRLWEVSSGEQLRCFELSGHGVTSSASFSQDGREIATASENGIFIWDTASSEVDRRFDFLDILDIDNGSAVFSPDGSTLVTTAQEERAAYVWDSETGELLGLLRHPDFVYGAEASPDGETIVTRMRNREDTSIDAAWVWDANHRSLTLAATAQSLVVEGLERGRQGDVERMLAALEEAQNISPGDGALLRPSVWDRACRYGSLAREATAVLEACETAVRLAEVEGEDIGAAMAMARIRDSRGLARALTGDTAGAIEDFQYFVENNTWFGPSDAGDLRLSWINALQNGRDPFDEATLEALRDEYE